MQAWESFLKTLQQQVGDETFSKWLAPLKLVHFDACNLYLEAQNSFQIEWFEEHIRAKAKKEFRNNNSRPIKIHITSSEIEAKSKKTKKESEETKEEPYSISRDSLLSEMTEETFIFSSSNQILSAILKSLQLPNSTPEFNPLFFYGGFCSGKTHLLQAFANALQKKGMQALYVKAETFMQNMIQAIRSGSMPDFRREYRHVDVLIFDDVQYLGKKAATQEEFFHTFNALQSQGKSIILSSDTLPSLLQDIEPRLISRFEWGLVLPIHKLEKQDLLRMLKTRTKSLNFPLSDVVLRFLIETFSSSLKSLQQSVDALVLRSKISARSISIHTVQELLKDLIEVEKKQVLNPKRIVQSVAHFFSLNSEEILGKSQTQECTLPRQIAMFLCRSELKMPYTKIGEHFKRDHSTVITSVRSIEEKLKDQDNEISSTLVSIKQQLQSEKA